MEEKDVVDAILKSEDTGWTTLVTSESLSEYLLGHEPSLDALYLTRLLEAEEKARSDIAKIGKDIEKKLRELKEKRDAESGGSSRAIAPPTKRPYIAPSPHSGHEAMGLVNPNAVQDRF
ncbi:hypothetical protein U1Q18_042716 [Sarracenia purpurea var. burkii]